MQHFKSRLTKIKHVVERFPAQEDIYGYAGITREVSLNAVQRAYELAQEIPDVDSDNQRLAQLRKFTFEGTEYEMWAHLKYGNRPGKQLRIHFAVDHDKRRIIVGWIGEHMDNATTRSMH